MSDITQSFHGTWTKASLFLFLGMLLSHATVGTEEKKGFLGKEKKAHKKHNCETSTVGRESNCKSQTLVLCV